MINLGKGKAAEVRLIDLALYDSLGRGHQIFIVLLLSD
jgi:hypothetical protein